MKGDIYVIAVSRCANCGNKRYEFFSMIGEDASNLNRGLIGSIGLEDYCECGHDFTQLVETKHTICPHGCLMVLYENG